MIMRQPRLLYNNNIIIIATFMLHCIIQSVMLDWTIAVPAECLMSKKTLSEIIT